MPLIVLSGTPASGKSTRAQDIKKFFEDQKQKKVLIVNETEAIKSAGYGINEYFKDSLKEKHVRADLKSRALRSINKNDLVIFDAGNYIKGYRYEIFCATKSARNTQCTIFCAISKDKSWELNENRENDEVKYSKEVFDALWLRYEEPNSSNRWDSPMISVCIEDDLDLEEVYCMLYEMKPPPANQSTQNVSIFIILLLPISNSFVSGSIVIHKFSF